MKKITALLIGLLFICSLANGQYKINKTKYDFRDYSYQVGDPYNTGIAGVCSFLVPGLGQMVSGETGRGVAFLGTDLGFSIMYLVGLLKMTEDIQNGGIGENGSGLFAVGAIGMLTVTIWSTIDAVRVAKVNNLAFRDKNKSSYNFKIQPFVSTINKNSIPKSVTGLTFIATF